MRDDQIEQLKRTQETAIDHTIEAIDAADSECDISTQEGRGDRVWLTKGANESMKLACSIERLLQMIGTGKDANEDADLEKEAAKIVRKATKQYEEYTARKS